jgi:two-component system, LuxR family, response regulator FixJ
MMTDQQAQPRAGAHTPTIFIVDDDEGMRQGLTFMLKTLGRPVKAFDSARAFMEYYDPKMPGCLLLDVRMAGMSGLDLQEYLRTRQVKIPVIILTAYADVSMAVRAMRAGAFDFFEKPVDRHRLVERITQALESDGKTRIEDDRLREINEHINRLSPREREVMELIVTGALNKEIADMLKISIKTVETHRARVMEKMQAEYVADLVRMAIAAGIE